MIPSDQLLIQSCGDEPKGGQHVGYVSAKVKVVHIPTGTSATVDLFRSQMKNKRVAIEMIEWALESAKRC